MQILDEMVQPPQSSSPEDPDRPVERLSSDEPLWEGGRPREPGPAPAAGPAPADPAAQRPPWLRTLRVNLLLAGAAAALLLVGFGAGAAVGGRDRPTPAASTPVSATVATATSIVVQPGPPPRACTAAVEAADRAIALLVDEVRGDRVTTAVQEYVDSKRACQRAVR